MAVPISMPRYRAIESSEMISAPSLFASSTPTPVLPLAVGPVKNQQLAAGRSVVMINGGRAGTTAGRSAQVERRLSAVRFEHRLGRFSRYGGLSIGPDRPSIVTAARQVEKVDDRVDDSQRILEELMAVIASRRAAAPDDSYTARLLAGGVDTIGRKITEEAAEVVEAAAEPGKEGQEHLVREAADLVYHLLVMLAARERGLADVEAELARRFGISGLEEKASRGNMRGDA